MKIKTVRSRLASVSVQEQIIKWTSECACVRKRDGHRENEWESATVFVSAWMLSETQWNAIVWNARTRNCESVSVPVCVWTRLNVCESTGFTWVHSPIANGKWRKWLRLKLVWIIRQFWFDWASTKQHYKRFIQGQCHLKSSFKKTQRSIQIRRARTIRFS